jgi:hypothetical protein
MGFKQILVSLNRGLHPFEITSSGIKFSQPFIDSLHEEEEKFKSKIMVDINDVVGIQKWHILFSEYPIPKETYFADIYAASEEDFYKIVAIIKDRITDIDFRYYYKGDVS